MGEESKKNDTKRIKHKDKKKRKNKKKPSTKLFLSQGWGVPPMYSLPHITLLHHPHHPSIRQSFSPQATPDDRNWITSRWADPQKKNKKILFLFFFFLCQTNTNDEHLPPSPLSFFSPSSLSRSFLSQKKTKKEERFLEI